MMCRGPSRTVPCLICVGQGQFQDEQGPPPCQSWTWNPRHAQQSSALNSDFSSRSRVACSMYASKSCLSMLFVCMLGTHLLLFELSSLRNEFVKEFVVHLHHTSRLASG